MPSWLVGTRDAGSATELMQDLASRLAGRVQLTTDGLKAYLSAVEDAFGGDIDLPQLVKIYGPALSGLIDPDRTRALGLLVSLCGSCQSTKCKSEGG